MTTITTSAPRVDGMSDADQDVLNGLWVRLRARAPRNRLRTTYFDSKAALVDLGISLPPQLRDIGAVVGWPSKAVNAMSRRTVLDGFRAIGADANDFGLDEVMDSNGMSAKVPQTHTSALVHSCAFTFVTNGDVASGEPKALITTRDALNATAEWDPITGGVMHALEIVARDTSGRPVSFVLHFHGRYIAVRWNGRKWAGVERRHAFGMPVEPIAYQAELGRPFGHSRISRPVMYYTDAAVRTMLRTEVGAEFYNAPQRYVLGAGDDAFTDDAGNPVPAWTVMLGRLLTLSRDENGDMPSVGAFAQQTMQPNLDQLRLLAMQFAGESSLPVGSLGIVQDNPESAEAIRARHEDLGVEIEHWRRTALTPAWTRQVRRALTIVDGSDAARRAYATLRPQWGSWSAPSEVSQAQAALARVQAIPALAETDVELERMGYTRDEIDSIRAQWSRSASRADLSALLSAAQSPVGAQAIAGA